MEKKEKLKKYVGAIDGMKMAVDYLILFSLPMGAGIFRMFVRGYPGGNAPRFAGRVLCRGNAG